MTVYKLPEHLQSWPQIHEDAHFPLAIVLTDYPFALLSSAYQSLPVNEWNEIMYDKKKNPTQYKNIYLFTKM